MKKYIVEWREIGDEKGTIVMATDDMKKAYEYAHKCPYGKEWTVYCENKIESQGMRA